MGLVSVNSVYNVCACYSVVYMTCIQLLEYVGLVSAECRVHPDEALNVPFHVPDEVLPAKVEQSVRKSLSVEHVEEVDYVTRTSADINR